MQNSAVVAVDIDNLTVETIIESLVTKGECPHGADAFDVKCCEFCMRVRDATN